MHRFVLLVHAEFEYVCDHRPMQHCNDRQLFKQTQQPRKHAQVHKLTLPLAYTVCHDSEMLILLIARLLTLLLLLAALFRAHQESAWHT
jgi:hypothetical protein